MGPAAPSCSNHLRICGVRQMKLPKFDGLQSNHSLRSVSFRRPDRAVILTLLCCPFSPISMASTATTPPPIQAPTAKEKKYDRQLRLWAPSGQRALEESHVVLIVPDQGTQGSGSSVAGVETLKNLVLPGIGSFTIADSAVVTEADLGINFFLEADSLGKSRAKECTRLLEELNPDVRGHVVTQVSHRAGGHLVPFFIPGDAQ
jgi:hypothetical protein